MEDRAKERLSAELDHFRVFFEQAPICVHEIDTNGRLLTMNAAGLDLASVRSEEEIRGRSYLVLSGCNNSLARAVDEQHLLDAFCNILVDVGGYAFAWVGYARQEPDLHLCMKAHAGHRDAELPAAVIAWASP